MRRVLTVLAMVVLIQSARPTTGQDGGGSLGQLYLNGLGSPWTAAGFVNRGVGSRAKGDIDRAIAQYTEAIRRDPNLAPAHSNRGAAWRLKGDYDKALADCNRAIRLDPRYAPAYVNRGNTWQSTGDSDRAIADYTEAIRLDPKLVLAYNNRGSCWRRKGDSGRAIADYTEAIRLHPRDAQFYNSRGNCWTSLGRYDQAIADHAESIRLNPRSAPALNDRARLQATCPDPRYRDGKQAVESATRTCELTDWKIPGVLDTLAAAYAEAGDFDTAVKCLQKALELTTERQVQEQLRGHLALFQAKTPCRAAPLRQ